jgi:NHL repeat
VFVVQNTKLTNAMKLLPTLGAVCVLTLTSGAYGQTLANFSAANLALGQPNLTTTCYVSPVTAASLNQPRGIAVDAASRKIFIADTEDNRLRHRHLWECQSKQNTHHQAQLTTRK